MECVPYSSLLLQARRRRGPQEEEVAAVDDEEDEAELDRMEAFESNYNFRFEQEGGTEIVSYGRHVEVGRYMNACGTLGFLVWSVCWPLSGGVDRVHRLAYSYVATRP